MNPVPAPSLFRTLARSPSIATLLYVIVVAGFFAAATLAISTIVDRFTTLAQTSETLEQLRSRQGRGPAATSAKEPLASPFLEGSTLTVAGAVLLQRVASAVNAAGGSIQSSQVDVTTQGKDGLVSLQISSEMEQPALQKVLFDLEAGRPVLFVDQLDVQVPQTLTANDGSGGRIRVTLGVSGQWLGAK
jgi:general secretion pathway protein M